MLPGFENQPFTVKILNLISQANPVAITPKYNNERVDAKVGLEFQEFLEPTKVVKGKLQTKCCRCSDIFIFIF